MIEQLKKEEKGLQEALNENRAKQKAYNIEQFCKHHGIKIGDTVKFTEYKKEYFGVICDFEGYGVNVTYPIVTLLNSDGKFGKRTKRIWSGSLGTIEVINHKL